MEKNNKSNNELQELTAMRDHFTQMETINFHCTLLNNIQSIFNSHEIQFIFINN